MQKILVTGGAGFIGAHLTQKLIEEGYQVMVVDNLSTIGGIPYINPKCKFLKADITKKKTIKILERWKPKIIFHLAAQSGGESAYDNPKYDYLTNGYGTYLISKLAQKIKAKKLIYASSVAVYGSRINKKITENTNITPDSIYGISKFAGEMFLKQVLEKTSTKTLILRVFNTYGPGENLNFLKKGMVSIYCYYLWKKKPIVVKGSLKRFRNFQYIDDVVNVFVKSIKNKKLKKNETINLTCGKLTSVKNLIKMILSLNRTNLKKYKVIVSNPTMGDSFAWNASSSYLLKKYNNYKFTSLKVGLNKYFKWIKRVPKIKNLRGYHPLDIKNK